MISGIVYGRVGIIDFYTRKFIRGHPSMYFVFGDNVRRIGLGGQAKEARGEPNTIGIATKWAPTMETTAYFSDASDCIEIVLADLAKIREVLLSGHDVVLPKDGIGTGLAMLPEKAPRINALINNCFFTLRKEFGDYWVTHARS